ncbi:MAG TPA: hypothetical protein VMT52_20470 [Planctomycetota bacterium]|nr:hypothetical protein [Planctomycetota bacterium]
MKRFRQIGVAIGLGLFLAFPQGRLRADLDEATSGAIDRGIEYLLRATEERIGSLEKEFGGRSAQANQENGLGRLALEVYALVVAGVSLDHPVIRRSFLFLEKMTFDHTYSTAIYAFALDAAIAQIEDDLLMFRSKKVQQRFRDDPAIGRVFRPRLAEAVRAIVQSQNDTGGWRYGPGAKDFDNSNVQFAVLALGVGAKRQVPIETEVWLKVVDHFVKGQEKNGPEIRDRLTFRSAEERGRPRDDVKLISKDRDVSRNREKAGERERRDGSTTVVAPPEEQRIGEERIEVFQRGWDYVNKGGSNWNMTCAGLSSLLLARDNLRGRIAGEQKEALDKAIRDGYGWVMGHWTPTGSYYGIYSIEKAADIGEVVKFGPHDWYAEISRYLVGAQRHDGSWPKGSSHGEEPPISTAFALLVLNRATSLLTQNPVSRIVVSGKRSADDPTDRSWVYVPDLDTTIHYPSLLRSIRLRPSPKLLRFLENIVDNYLDERKGELVPELAFVRDSIPNRTAQRIVDDYLVKITGYRYKDPEDYRRWYARWERIIRIGEAKKQERKDDLLKYYASTTKSVPLRKTIMWALGQIGAREAIPLLLEDLSHAEATVRLSAYNYFKAYFLDFPPPFDPSAGESTREGQVAAIREWYAKQR